MENFTFNFMPDDGPLVPKHVAFIEDNIKNCVLLTVGTQLYNMSQHNRMNYNKIKMVHSLKQVNVCCVQNLGFLLHKLKLYALHRSLQTLYYLSKVTSRSQRSNRFSLHDPILYGTKTVFRRPKFLPSSSCRF